MVKIKIMKNLLSILVVSLLLIGCSENRVLMDELINKGSNRDPIMYSEKGLFNGIGFDVFENGQIKYEENYKDGKREGIYKEWYENGELYYEGNYKDGKRVN